MKSSELFTPRNIIYTMLAIFVILIFLMVVQNVLDLGRRFFLVLAFLAFAWLGLGIVLVVKTYRHKVKGKLKWFYLIAGFSAIGVPVFAILHNLAYGLLMLMFGQGFWGETGDEPVFFILAIIICPLAFLVGSIGSLVVSGKQKKKVKK